MNNVESRIFQNGSKSNENRLKLFSHHKSVKHVCCKLHSNFRSFGFLAIKYLRNVGRGAHKKYALAHKHSYTFSLFNAAAISLLCAEIQIHEII